jgi:HlyD family secretion protein
MRLVAVVLLAGGTLACDDQTQPIVGTLERDRIELTSTFSEPITIIGVEEGDQVEAGATLAEQSSTRTQAQYRSAIANRDQQAARLAELVRGPRQERISEAIARRNRSEAMLAEAKVELRRVKDLKERGFTSDSEVDARQAAHDAAVAETEEAKATLESLLAGTTSEELDQARHAMEVAEAQVAEAEENLARLTFRAPVDATVEALPYEPGEIPPVGAPVVVLLRRGEPYARVYIPEPRRGAFGAGTEVLVDVDGNGVTLKGRVRYQSSDASFTPYFVLTRYDRSRLSYLAEIDLEGGENLPNGQPLEVRLEAGQ